MKRALVTLVGTVALAAGSAYAGGCNYGSHASMDEVKAPELASLDTTNPELLAKLKKQREEAEGLEMLVETPIIYN